MKPSLVRETIKVSALVLLTACSGANHRNAEVMNDRAGYSVNPADFAGYHFNPGKPALGDSLEDSLSEGSSRVQYAVENDLRPLKVMPREIPLKVLGFTDSKECADLECLELSQRRAQLLHDWLIRKGAPESRLGKPEGRGSSWPVDNNETDDGRTRNRRAYISY